MALYQVKQPRPTRQTAHEFFSKGYFAAGPAVSDAERQKKCDEISNQLLNLVRQKFPRTLNLEYAILKSHIIIEYGLDQFIKANSYVTIEKFHRNMTFSLKLEISYLMGFGVRSPTIIPSIEILSKIRNQCAHAFDFNRDEFDEMIRINSEDYEDFQMTDDKMRIRRLRQYCSFILGMISGELKYRAWYIGQLVEKYWSAPPPPLSDADQSPNVTVPSGPGSMNGL